MAEDVTDKPVEVDEHRGMAAQKSTETRRRLREVEADQVGPAPPPTGIQALCRDRSVDELAGGGREGAISDPAFCCHTRGARSASPSTDRERSRRSRPVIQVNGTDGAGRLGRRGGCLRHTPGDLTNGRGPLGAWPTIIGGAG